MVFLGVCWAAGGVGHANGDSLVYQVQIEEGDLAQRTIHVGYLCVGMGVRALFNGPLPLLMDHANAVIAAMAVAVVGVASPRAGWLAALGASAVALSIGPFAEVDALWWLGICLAASLPSRAAAVAAGLAMTVSPVTLLALPWAARRDRHRARHLFAGALAGLVLLTVVSGGDWWVGERGVLTAPSPRPLRTVLAWGWHLPWLLLPLAMRRAVGWRAELISLAPLLLAPPDVPSWLVIGTAIALRAAEAGKGPWLALVVPTMVWSGWLLAEERQRVIDEQRVVRQVAQAMGPDDGLIAPFSLAVRVAHLATGDPYGLNWRPEGRFLRDQQRRWCAGTPEQVWVLPSVDDAPLVPQRVSEVPTARKGCQAEGAP
jgi:hypothetical protein